MESAHKRCRDCGAEFQPWAPKCSDCGGELDWAAPEAPLEPAALDALAPTAELTRIRTGDPWDVRQLAEALQAAGIPCRVERATEKADPSASTDRMRLRETRELRLGVYVRPSDLAAAAEVETALVARRSPEIAELGPIAAPDTNACPACGAALDPAAARCPDCGLEFPEK